MRGPTLPGEWRPAGRAFTLIELLAVIVILAVIAATAAPALTHANAGARTAGAIHIARDIAYARERALATGTSTWIAFDADGLGYTLLGEDADAPGLAGATVIDDPAGRASFTVDLDTTEFAGVRIQAVVLPDGSSDLGFDWLGRPKDSSGALLSTDASIQVRDAPTITIHARTGLVTLSSDAAP